MKAAILIAAGLFLGACATTEAPGRSTQSYDILEHEPMVQSGDGPIVETLYAVTATREGLRLRVPSNGCTTKADFRMSLVPRPPGTPGRFAILFRLKPDTCRSFAIGSTWIEFSYAEMGVAASDKIQLSNALTAWTGPGE